VGTDFKGTEQMGLNHLLEIAWDEFDKSLLSAGSRFVLWGSFSTEGVLAASYLAAKGKSKLIDGRRTEKSRTSEENDLVEAVNIAAHDISTYVGWARNHGGGQPILREALVSYCVAFEAVLKNVALIFALAKSRPNGLDGVAFVPDNEFKRTLKLVKDGWKASNVSGQFRAKVFFTKFLNDGNPSPNRFLFDAEQDNDAWGDCWAAFDLRNAIVHQMARPSEQVTLAGTFFEIHREIELTPKHLRVVGESMRRVLSPLDPTYLSLGL
jgi:hypothetical protein